MNVKIFIVFSSPAGSTRRVAETIKKCMSQQNVEVVMLDLGAGDDGSEVLDSIQAADKQAWLFR